MDENTLVELQIKLAYQEDLLQELNAIVINQQQQINRLEQTCKILYERLKNLSFSEPLNEVDNQVPPHY